MPQPIPTVVYAIEYVGGFKHAQFYIGTTAANRLHERIEEHLTGRGAKINRRAREQGIRMRLVMVMQGTPTPWGEDHQLERYIKNQHNNARFIENLRKVGRSGNWQGHPFEFVD